MLQAYYTVSFGGHIFHEITRAAFTQMKAAVRIISSYDITPPMANSLEQENMPNPERIVRSIRETLSE